MQKTDKTAQFQGQRWLVWGSSYAHGLDTRAKNTRWTDPFEIIRKNTILLPNIIPSKYQRTFLKWNLGHTLNFDPNIAIINYYSSWSMLKFTGCSHDFEVFNARSGDWMWDFRPCPLDSVPFRWRDKAFFIATRLDHSSVACYLPIQRGHVQWPQMTTNVHNIFQECPGRDLVDLEYDNKDCFRDVTEIVSWNDCRMFNGLYLHSIMFCFMLLYRLN